MDVPGCQAKQIDQLPIEILQEIFHYIGTSDLLRRCRLVCQTWYPLVTSRCRKRRVNVKDMYDSDPSVREIFKRDTDLPWSAVEFVFGNGPDVQKFNADVCETFGARIQFLLASMVHTSQYRKFVRELGKMTKLQGMELELWPDSSDSVTSFVFPRYGEVQLRKLRQLELKYNPDPASQFVDLLEFILLNTGAPVKSLSITELDEYGLQVPDFKRMTQIIGASKVENLSLELAYESAQFPIWKILMKQLSSRIDELAINMLLSGSEIRNRGTFRLLECCLAKCTRLRTLILLNFEVTGDGPCQAINISSLLQFPTLGHLENLKVLLRRSHFNGQYNPDPEFPVVNFSLLKSRNFPKLKAVQVEVLGDNNPLTTIDIRKIFEPSAVNLFNNVESLDIGNYHSIQRLSTIFPNLMKISATSDDSKYLCPIFEGNTNLIEVDLTLSSNSDNNVLLSDAVRFILRSLKKLRTLTVRNYRCVFNTKTKDLDDVGLIVLTLLHPLNLIIYNSKVKETDSCVALLRTVHLQLQLLY